MNEQQLKGFCQKALERVPIPPNKQERIRVATDFADRLYVADYLSKQNRQDFVKNELVCHFDLTDEEVGSILEKMEKKEQRINDKLQIYQFKEELKHVEIYSKDLMYEGFNFEEVKKIIEYIESDYNINNKKMLKDFILDNLCTHFELEQEEIKEIEKFCSERGIR